MPALTLAVLVLMFGAYALVDGIFNVVAAVSGRSGARSWGRCSWRVSSASAPAS